MVYNEKYFFEFDTLKTADKATLYYRVVFLQKESVATTYDLVELTPSNSPFVLSYKSSEDFAFSPFRVSSAEINILYPLGASADVPQPENFFTFQDNTDWLVKLYQMTDNGATSTLNWQGYLITSDIQYEWQDAYYYRLTATDNLGVLKDMKYSRTDRYAMRPYDPMAGAELIEYIPELLSFTNNELNIKVACNLKNDNVTKYFDDILISKFSAIDWETGEARNCHEILSKLLQGLGCILYLDNSDCTWTILNINEIATTANNEVPYKLYDSDGGYLDDGIISFNDTINMGGEYIWRDKNQIVTLKRPIGYLKFNYPYQRKNILKNYGFQDLVDDIDANWSTVGTFSTITDVIPSSYSSLMDSKYDNVFTRIDEYEASSGSVDYVDYLRNLSTLSISDLNSIVNPLALNEYFNVFVKFKYITNSSDYVDGDGFNYQIVVGTGATSDYYFDDINANGLSYPYKVWSFNTASRCAEFISGVSNKTTSVKLLTSFLKIPVWDTLELRFLKYRTDGLSGGSYSIDDVEMNITTPNWMLVNKLGFFASNGGFKNNAKEIDTLFHTGTSKIDWWVFEDCIGLKATYVLDTYPQSNNLWCRAWEEYTEFTDETLMQKNAKSIISFYRENTRKFTGNVYGDYMSFCKYFNINYAIDNSALGLIEDTFEAYVLADGGTCETATCSSNFLAEFNQPYSNFLMIEASIDIANSTTNVVLHEDLTSTNELNFTSGASHTYNTGGGIFPANMGGNISMTQNTIE